VVVLLFVIPQRGGGICCSFSVFVLAVILTLERSRMGKDPEINRTAPAFQPFLPQNSDSFMPRLKSFSRVVVASDPAQASNATMDKKQLGNSDLHLSPIGFGAWAIGGGDWAFAWGDQDDNDSIAAIHKALDLGINWIDTAAVYGLGHSEEVVARALKTTSHKPYIFTKSTMVWDEKREVTNSQKQIRRECEDSLRRLQVEAIDLYQVHWPKPDEDIEEGWSVMADLQREGKVRWIGVSNFSVAQMERVMKIAPITSQQPPYSMLNRTYEAENLPFCKAHNIGVLNYAPMHSGLLTGAMSKERVANFPANDFRRNAKNYQEPLLSRNLAVADKLKQIGARHKVSAGVIAIAWTLHNPAITAAIVGGRNAKQVEGVIPAATFRLTEPEYAEINTFLAAHPPL
jgi:aryl-alcohol dehydrogenase-like predicted oxidoreductase